MGCHILRSHIWGYTHKKDVRLIWVKTGSHQDEINSWKSDDTANNMSLCVRKPTIWVSTRSDTNRPVQSQKNAGCLKFCIIL